MANSFATPQPLPLLDRLGTGQPLRGVELQLIGGALNHAHSRGRAEVCISESWSGPVTWGGVGKRAILKYWVPFLSSRHTVTTVWVLCHSTTGEGAIHAQWGGGAETSKPAPVAGSPSWVNVSVTAAHDADGLALVLSATPHADSGSDVRIYAVSAFPAELASPLAAAAAGAFSPVGLATLVADRALSAARGAKLALNLGELMARARVAVASSWPDLPDPADNLYGSPLPLRDALGLAPYHAGDRYEWTARYYLRAPPSGTVYVRIVALSAAPGVYMPRLPQVLAEAAHTSVDGDGWKSIAFDFAVGGPRTFDAWQQAHYLVGVLGAQETGGRRTLSLGDTPPEAVTTAALESLTIWGA